MSQIIKAVDGMIEVLNKNNAEYSEIIMSPSNYIKMCDEATGDIEIELREKCKYKGLRVIVDTNMSDAVTIGG